ncbi:MAG: selenium metabolism-associated LysR family transcriptional regulator [Thermodesulfobacteriota bacterium]|nr:selenium metabolism-associated LysR family transcriptional regulator [Thermodesulfobacteriota bacterium]
MDLRRVEIFCLVYELESFSKAAETLCLTQPTVSDHIKLLEEELGLSLLDRGNKSVIPTEAGEILYHYGRQIVKLKGEAQQLLTQIHGLTKGTIIIGGSSIPGNYILPPIISAFMKQFPQIFIEVIISDTKDIVDRVLADLVEIGFVGTKMQEDRLLYTDFIEDELVLVADHSLYNSSDCIEWNKIQSLPFVMREKGSGTRATIEKVMNMHGVNFHDLTIVAEIWSTEGIIKSIKAGLGVSLLSRVAVQEEIQKGVLKAIEMDNTEFKRNFFIIQRKKKTLSPAANAFLRFVEGYTKRWQMKEV